MWTRAALSAAKARGARLGANAQVLADAESKAAIAFATPLLPELKRMRALGYSIRRICVELNAADIPARGGGRWAPHLGRACHAPRWYSRRRLSNERGSAS